jgi:RNA polymerase sigma-B factor
MTAQHDEDDDRVQQLLEELARTGRHDPRWEELSAEIVRIHQPFIRYIASRYSRHGEPREDVEQAAMLGLVKAINGYDPEVGRRFMAYASPTVIGEVKRHFRDRTWSMRMPRRLQELRLSLRTVRSDFLRDHGRAPTVREMSVLMGISEEEVIEALEAADAYRPISLDSPVSEEVGGETLGDLIGEEDPDIETVVDRTAVRPLLEKLPERERTILMYRFFGNKTQAEIAELMDLSQMHVSRLISRSLARLRAQLLEDR